MSLVFFSKYHPENIAKKIMKIFFSKMIILC